MEKKLLFLLFIIIAFNLSVSAQKSKADELHQEAVQLMDEKGDYEGAIKLLKQAEKIDPRDPDHKYEEAFAYYSMKDYDKAKDILVDIVTDKKATFRYYQLLGNVYDIQEQPDKAITVYKAGLKKFPNTGNLYSELGIVEWSRKNYQEAANYFEEGIKVDPKYPTCYYWAAKLYAGSTERIWGIMYGEIFMNLERNTKRTETISKLLYDTYRDAITIKDTSGSVQFTKNNVIYVDAKKLKNKKDFSKILPFGTIYEATMSKAITPNLINHDKDLGIDDLSDIRKRFIETWYQGSFGRDYKNIVLEWHRNLDNKGYLDSYNHWLMMKGNEDEFDAWLKQNKDKYDEFVAWFNNNPMPVSVGHQFYRTQYTEWK